jgi:hypothetical protein
VTLCRLMVSDFEHGTGRYRKDMGPGQLYNKRNLEFGYWYASDYLAIGVTRDPVQDFDLAAFKSWCAKKLKLGRKFTSAARALPHADACTSSTIASPCARTSSRSRRRGTCKSRLRSARRTTAR